MNRRRGEDEKNQRELERETSETREEQKRGDKVVVTMNLVTYYMHHTI